MKRLEATNFLALEDYSGDSPEKVRESVIPDFEITRAEIDKYQILIAYRSVGDYGCDSSAWFLLRDRESGALFEVHGSHCSCMGFEGQWKPEPTTREYLKSDKFSFSMGGYDNNINNNRDAAKKYIASL